MDVKKIWKTHSQQQAGKHVPCEYLMSTIWTFDGIESKHDVCRSEGYIKKVCESLTEYPMKIPLTSEK